MGPKSETTLKIFDLKSNLNLQINIKFNDYVQISKIRSIIKSVYLFTP